jgi:hypothetical protein
MYATNFPEIKAGYLCFLMHPEGTAKSMDWVTANIQSANGSINRYFFVQRKPVVSRQGI